MESGMPLYEYECFVCKTRFEKIQKVSDDPVRDCPKCSGAVRRLLGVPALQFKGSGWYVTDYGKGRSEASANAGESTATDTSKGDTKDDSAKSATSTESKQKAAAPASS
jgi:putative FmdB family regulatory protein